MSTTTLHSADVAGAVAELMRDTDSLADWLYGSCYMATPAKWERSLRGITEHDLDGWSVPRLLALAFDSAQHSTTRSAALDAIQKRYLASTDDLMRRVMARASELAAQRDEDVREEA